MITTVISRRPEKPADPTIPVPTPTTLLIVFGRVIRAKPGVTRIEMKTDRVVNLHTVLPVYDVRIRGPYRVEPPVPLSLWLVATGPVVYTRRPTMTTPTTDPLVPVSVRETTRLVKDMEVRPARASAAAPVVGN